MVDMEGRGAKVEVVARGAAPRARLGSPIIEMAPCIGMANKRAFWKLTAKFGKVGNL